jgi:sporulation protein YlmC with PRC-barrel domain
MLFKSKTLSGHTMHSRDGVIGKVKEFYFDDQLWAIRYLVADTGSWLTGRQVLISPYALGTVNGGKQEIAIDLTKKQIEDSPSVETDKPVSRQFEESYYAYYGWPTYWSGSYMWGPTPYIVPRHEKAKATNPGGKEWNGHLRSTSTVSGYKIHASDGEIGHVEDFLIDDETWAIRYLVVDTRNWWPGKKVLVSPKWIEGVSWDLSKVTVGLSKDAIKKSPEYSEEVLLTRDYETRLHGHYNRQGYWIGETAAKQHSHQ